MPSRSKPVGVILIGVMMVSFGAILALIAAVLAGGNVLIFETAQPTWLLLAGSGVGLVVAYSAIRVGLGLLRDPGVGRKAGEVAIWMGIPIVWLALGAINLLVTEGQDDVALWGVIAAAGVFWSAVLVGAALYMRSWGVRSNFDDTST
ncbi:MAG: hypothetical protein ACR2ME_01235 [Acidimicrobiia bacterium]